MTEELPKSAASLTHRIKEKAQKLGFDLVGITGVQPSEHAAFLQNWLKRGHHGEMHYLSRTATVQRRTDPRTAWPTLKSAIVVAENYYSGAAGEAQSGKGKIAQYARGGDYHKVMKKKLLELLRFIEAAIGQPLPAARAYVDTGPVLERELAQRAGLGWFGRNTMLLNPKRGSYFFLGTLLVELELDPDTPFAADHCGTCSACVEACPTGALLGRDAQGAPVIDARRCISYLTIEQRGPIPHELRGLIGNHIFGCDICQDVCPWNAPKFVQLTRETGYRKRSALNTDAPDLIQLMQLNEKQWDELTRGSAMRRAGYAGFKRNIAVALGNWGSPAAVPVLTDALADANPLVRGHAAWALGRIRTEESRLALKQRLEVEADEFTRTEIEIALTN
jgi:epoxyqueuosine reductase